MTTRAAARPHPTVPGRRAASVISGLALMTGGTAACGAEGGPSAEVATAPTELSAHDGVPCPEELPQASEETHGFGTDEPATASPDLPPADQGWVCTYASDLTHRREDGEAVFTWRRQGLPERLDEDQLADAQVAVEAFEPPAREERACTADLGPRWMVVLSDDGDLTGVVVDGYGCRDVRLTAEPHTEVAGNGAGDVVAGVLDGGPVLLRALGLGAR